MVLVVVHCTGKWLQVRVGRQSSLVSSKQRAGRSSSSDSNAAPPCWTVVLMLSGTWIWDFSASVCLSTINATSPLTALEPARVRMCVYRHGNASQVSSILTM